MVRLRTLRALSFSDLDVIRGFLTEAHALDCAQLSDHLHTDLEQGPRDGFVAVLAEDESGVLVGYAQASVGNDGFVVDSIVWSSYDGDIDATRLRLLRAVVDEVPADDGVTWWTHRGDGVEPVAVALGLVPGRALLQMRRPLPLPPAIVPANTVEVRPFVVGTDEGAWLAVNNAAFEWHGEQGGWDLITLHQREREPWFRAEGFLLHEREGRLAAFCWTKVHPRSATGDTLMGEIYVIAVHPDFHGRGLGRALTVAGLDSLTTAGADEAMLYVDAANTSAVGLYASLGFEVSHTDQAYVRSPKGTPS